MSIQLKAKFWQYLLNKNQNQGFTLIQLFFGIAVIIIAGLGIVFFLDIFDCSQGGKQSEAKQYVGAMNREQQAYFLDQNRFANSMDKLGIGIKTETENYQYSVQTTGKEAYNYAIARKSNLKSYVGGVLRLPDLSLSNDFSTIAILCETKSTGNRQVSHPIMKNNQLVCGADTKEIGR
jgi:type II secretory pathway pseudopilin PulG